jgi:hypothetical protein
MYKLNEVLKKLDIKRSTYYKYVKIFHDKEIEIKGIFKKKGANFYTDEYIDNFRQFMDKEKYNETIEIKEDINIDSSIDKSIDTSQNRQVYGLVHGQIDKSMDFLIDELKSQHIKELEIKNEVIEKFEKRIKVKSQKQKKIDIEYNLKSLENPLLIKYLESRKLNISICKKFLKEIYYKKNEKEYFGICIENISGGFEIRNSIFKGTIGSKNITEFSGINNKKVNVFEGFIDFISYLTLENQKKLQNKNIILNSIMNIKNVDFDEYIEINLYLDNDEIGKKTVQDLEKKFKVIDQSKKYQGFKDINDYLKSI